MNRREFTALSAGALAAVGLRPNRSDAAPASEHAFTDLRTKSLRIGMLVFERMDQIDFTGPFSVLSRLPDAVIEVMTLDAQPIRDHKGLVLTPQAAFTRASAADVLVVPGGPGQEALMQHAPLLDGIAAQAAAGKALFSVCTGALLCGAAGVLRGRRATTHWASFDLLHFFGAQPVDERVVLDGNVLTAAGVTAGIDGALRLAALVRGEEIAQQIQLDIQYAPEPPFAAGSPATASRAVLETVKTRYRPLTELRRKTAEKYAEDHAR